MDSGYPNLAELLNSVESDGKLSPTVQYWLADGIREYAGGEKLEKALNLHGAPGKRKANTMLMDAIKDGYLLEAWEMVTDEPIKHPQRSKLLYQKMGRFETSKYRAFRHYDQPPESLSEFQVILFNLYKTGGQLPGTERGLHERIMRILEDHGGD